MRHALHSPSSLLRRAIVDQQSEARAHTQNHSATIKVRVLRSDRGMGFLSDAFDEHFAAAGTVHRLTVLNRPFIEEERALPHMAVLPQPESMCGEDM